MKWWKTSLALLAMFALPIALGIAAWSFYRSFEVSRLEATMENPKTSHRVFRDGDTPCVQLLDLRIASGSMKDPDEVVLIATAQYEGPKAETIDVTGLAFSIHLLCRDALVASVVAEDDPPDAIVCRGLIRCGMTVEPFDPFVVAFSCGRRGVTPNAAATAFATVKLSEKVLPECQVPAGRIRFGKFVDIAMDRELRVRPWDRPRPSLKGDVTVIPPDGSEPYEPPALP